MITPGGGGFGQFESEEERHLREREMKRSEAEEDSSIQITGKKPFSVKISPVSGLEIEAPPQEAALIPPAKKEILDNVRGRIDLFVTSNKPMHPLVDAVMLDHPELRSVLREHLNVFQRMQAKVWDWKVAYRERFSAKEPAVVTPTEEPVEEPPAVPAAAQPMPAQEEEVYNPYLEPEPAPVVSAAKPKPVAVDERIIAEYPRRMAQIEFAKEQLDDARFMRSSWVERMSTRTFVAISVLTLGIAPIVLGFKRAFDLLFKQRSLEKYVHEVGHQTTAKEIRDNIATLSERHTITYDTPSGKKLLESQQSLERAVSPNNLVALAHDSAILGFRKLEEAIQQKKDPSAKSSLVTLYEAVQILRDLEKLELVTYSKNEKDIIRLKYIEPFKEALQQTEKLNNFAELTSRERTFLQNVSKQGHVDPIQIPISAVIFLKATLALSIYPKDRKRALDSLSTIGTIKAVTADCLIREPAVNALAHWLGPIYEVTAVRFGPLVEAVHLAGQEVDGKNYPRLIELRDILRQKRDSLSINDDEYEVYSHVIKAKVNPALHEIEKAYPELKLETRRQSLEEVLKIAPQSTEQLDHQLELLMNYYAELNKNPRMVPNYKDQVQKIYNAIGQIFAAKIAHKGFEEATPKELYSSLTRVNDTLFRSTYTDNGEDLSRYGLAIAGQNPTQAIAYMIVGEATSHLHELMSLLSKDPLDHQTVSNISSRLQTLQSMAHFLKALKGLNPDFTNISDQIEAGNAILLVDYCIDAIETLPLVPRKSEETPPVEMQMQKIADIENERFAKVEELIKVGNFYLRQLSVKYADRPLIGGSKLKDTDLTKLLFQIMKTLQTDIDVMKRFSTTTLSDSFTKFPELIRVAEKGVQRIAAELEIHVPAGMVALRLNEAQRMKNRGDHFIATAEKAAKKNDIHETCENFYLAQQKLNQLRTLAIQIMADSPEDWDEVGSSIEKLVQNLQNNIRTYSNKLLFPNDEIAAIYEEHRFPKAEILLAATQEGLTEFLKDRYEGTQVKSLAEIFDILETAVLVDTDLIGARRDTFLAEIHGLKHKLAMYAPEVYKQVMQLRTDSTLATDFAMLHGADSAAAYFIRSQRRTRNVEFEKLSPEFAAARLLRMNFDLDFPYDYLIQEINLVSFLTEPYLSFLNNDFRVQISGLRGMREKRREESQKADARLAIENDDGDLLIEGVEPSRETVGLYRDFIKRLGAIVFEFQQGALMVAEKFSEIAPQKDKDRHAKRIQELRQNALEDSSLLLQLLFNYLPQYERVFAEIQKDPEVQVIMQKVYELTPFNPLVAAIREGTIAEPPKKLPEVPSLDRKDLSVKEELIPYYRNIISDLLKQNPSEENHRKMGVFLKGIAAKNAEVYRSLISYLSKDQKEKIDEWMGVGKVLKEREELEEEDKEEAEVEERPQLELFREDYVSLSFSSKDVQEAFKTILYKSLGNEERPFSVLGELAISDRMSSLLFGRTEEEVITSNLSTKNELERQHLEQLLKNIQLFRPEIPIIAMLQSISQKRIEQAQIYQQKIEQAVAEGRPIDDYMERLEELAKTTKNWTSNFALNHSGKIIGGIYLLCLGLKISKNIDRLNQDDFKIKCRRFNDELGTWQLSRPRAGAAEHDANAYLIKISPLIATIKEKAMVQFTTPESEAKEAAEEEESKDEAAAVIDKSFYSDAEYDSTFESEIKRMEDRLRGLEEVNIEDVEEIEETDFREDVLTEIFGFIREVRAGLSVYSPGDRALTMRLMELEFILYRRLNKYPDLLSDDMKDKIIECMDDIEKKLKIVQPLMRMNPNVNVDTYAQHLSERADKVIAEGNREDIEKVKGDITFLLKIISPESASIAKLHEAYTKLEVVA